MSDWESGRPWYPDAFLNEGADNTYNVTPTNYYSNQQYVGFNEFLNQMQQNRDTASSSYSSNNQYPIYNNISNHNSHQQTAQAPMHMYQTQSNNVLNVYNESHALNFSAANNRYFTSNLTPTATEFVPKNSQPLNTVSVPNAASTSRDRNITQIGEATPAKENNIKNDVHRNGALQLNTSGTSEKESRKDKKNNSKNKQKLPTKAPTTEDVGRTFYNSNKPKSSASQSHRSKNQDVRYAENYSRDKLNQEGENSNWENYKHKKGFNKDLHNQDGTLNHRDNRDSTSNDREGQDSTYNTRDNRDSTNNSRGNRDSTRETRFSTFKVRENRENASNSRERDITYNARENRESANNASQNRDSTYNRENRESTNNTRENWDNTYNARDNQDSTYSARENQDSACNSRENRDCLYNRDSTYNSRETWDSSHNNRENRDNSYNNSRGNRQRNGSNNYRENPNRESEYYNREFRENNLQNKYGTQRLHRFDRNVEEDEQYANSYMNYREDRQDSRRPVTSEKLQLVPASPIRNKSHKQNDKEDNSELTQRERLSDQLDRGMLECLVCCERVRQVDSVWSCGNCYHVLHLRCVRKWATSSLVEGKWRCPACQNTSESVPMDYMCFCGAMRAPEWVRGSTGAHSCGERCQRPRACVHPCVLPCHPGPCPPCQATLNKKCGCGAETRAVVCSSKLEQTCARTCGKRLACGAHYCTRTCHEGDCDICKEQVEQVCYCPAAKTRSVACTLATSNTRAWTCGEPCARVLACGEHVCRTSCHPPPCDPCARSPEAVLTCPCGKMKLSDKKKRASCMDPIPLCGNICAKPLSCGPPNDLHFCKLECHDGTCPACPDKTLMNCRCGLTNREVDCVDLPQMMNNIFCTKKCNKKLSCGRHRCRSLCCALDVHRCTQTCGRALTCGQHRCTELCHTGHCAPCARLGFTELRCACGSAVTLPPVACGARPPLCNAPCARARACGHPPHHACHQGDCPLCVVLTTKRCHGGHEERKTIPCHQDEFSCGLACGKPLPCGKHVCNKVCHKGDCATAKCTQQCQEKRAGCGHPCGAPCHVGAGDDTPCPSPTPCRLLVRATCPCKRRSQEKTCADNSRDFAKAMSTLVASKMQDGSAVDLSDVTRPGSNLITLECDDSCRVEARTRQMALVLQIRNPELSSKLAPRYSELVRAWAVREPAFVEHVHAQLTDLVQRAKKSKQKTRSHSFPSMNRQKRQLVHELCEHFGCESVAYDAEPNRNVVATADREKSWLPSMSVLEVLEREAGKRRVPGPVLRPAAAPAAAAVNKSSSGWATLTSSRSSNAWGARPTSAATPATPATSAATALPPAPAHPIDYFDNPPLN